MTYNELYKFSRDLLMACENDNATYETYTLCKHFLGADRMMLISEGNKTPDEELQKKFVKAVKKRSCGYPLQYIMGKWTFMDGEFFVGDGVLIPRDDTEVCVRQCIDAVKHLAEPTIIDLCSGSGIIAVTLAHRFPNAKIYALELSDKAFPYLEKNIDHNNAQNVTAIHGDIFTDYRQFEDGFFDAIISNPPYIETSVIPTLQQEVQHEPILALDGGYDGLAFYRSIVDGWLSKLKDKGSLTFEIGEEQGYAVSELMRKHNMENIEVIKDIQMLDRVVFGTKVAYSAE